MAYTNGSQSTAPRLATWAPAGILLEMQILRLTQNLMNKKFQEWSPAIYVLTNPVDDCDIH